MIMWRLLPLLDRGKQLDPGETRRQIEDGTILTWLADQGIGVDEVSRVSSDIGVGVGVLPRRISLIHRPNSALEVRASPINAPL